jgi:hypothetical protein
MAGHTLYIDNAQKRFFYLPNDVVCPPGDYRVQSLLGRELSTHPVILDVYEVSEEEAKKITEEGVYAFGRNLRSLLERVPGRTPDPTLHERSNNLAKLRGGLGDTLQQAATDPDAVAKKMDELTAPLQASAAQIRGFPERLRAVIEDPARQEEIDAATQRLRRATEELAAATRRKD